MRNSFLCLLGLSAAPDARTAPTTISTAPGASMYGCTQPEISFEGLGPPPTGTLLFNDKSKGTFWMLNLDTSTVLAVDLPLVNGNQESALSPDGKRVAIPHYETIIERGQSEGGGLAGHGFSVLDIDSGTASIPFAPGNPFGSPRPYGATWISDGSLLVTAELSNGILKYSQASVSGPNVRFDSVKTIDFSLMELSRDCLAPHLVELLLPEKTNFAVTGCRCTPSPINDECTDGFLTIFDHVTGEAKAFSAGMGAEGLAVTADGDVWVGAHDDNSVSVFGFLGKPTLESFGLKKKIKDIDKPLRLAYDSVGRNVAVVCLLPDSEEPNIHLFSATTRERIKSVALNTPKRGRVNSQGLSAFSIKNHGYFLTAGSDTQTVVVLDAATLHAAATIYMPYCGTPAGFCTPTPLSKEEAHKEGWSGSNNWSGGYCPATLRNQFDRRYAVFDGFQWSPLRPSWATTAQQRPTAAKPSPQESSHAVSAVIFLTSVNTAVGLTVLLAVIGALLAMRAGKVRMTGSELQLSQSMLVSLPAAS